MVPCPCHQVGHGARHECAVSGAQVRYLKDAGADEEGTDANDTLDLQPEYMREYMRALCVGWVVAPVPLDQQNVRV